MRWLAPPQKPQPCSYEVSKPRYNSCRRCVYGNFVEQFLRRLKSESAHRINRLLARQGRVWQDESFDHVLRREEGIDAKLDYIRLNPVRAGLVLQPGEYRWMWFEGCA